MSKKDQVASIRRDMIRRLYTIELDAQLLREKLESDPLSDSASAYTVIEMIDTQGAFLRDQLIRWITIEDLTNAG